MWNLKKKMNLFTKQKQTHRLENKLIVTRGKAGGGEINWEFGINIHTLLYIKEINNKDILYSARNTAEYSVIT